MNQTTDLKDRDGAGVYQRESGKRDSNRSHHSRTMHENVLGRRPISNFDEIALRRLESITYDVGKQRHRRARATVL